MSLLETMLSAAHSGVGQQLAQQFGLPVDQISSVVAATAPALAGGLKEKLAAPSGGGLIDLLTGGSLSHFAEDPGALTSPAAAQQGQNILTQIFGNNSLTNLIGGIAEKSGVGSSVLQSMFPTIVTFVMALLSKKVAGGSAADVTHLLDSLTGDHAGVFGTLKAAAHKLFG
jgi:hypothetical protein